MQVVCFHSKTCPAACPHQYAHEHHIGCHKGCHWQGPDFADCIPINTIAVTQERQLITQNLFDKPYHGVHALAKNKLTVICRGINERCDGHCYHRKPHECNSSCKIGQDVCSKGQACCLPIGIILVTQECYHHKRRWRRCDNCVDCGHCSPKDT